MKEDELLDRIMKQAGGSLFYCQICECNLGKLLEVHSGVGTAPRKVANDLFGLMKNRTETWRKMREGLLKSGLDPDHEFVGQIDRIQKKRDWLAHRMYLDFLDSDQNKMNWVYQQLLDFLDELRVFTRLTLRMIARLTGYPMNPDDPIAKLTEDVDSRAMDILRSMEQNEK